MPPQYPTTVDKTPGKAAYASSGCQNHPRAMVTVLEVAVWIGGASRGQMVADSVLIIRTAGTRERASAGVITANAASMYPGHDMIRERRRNSGRRKF